MRETRAADPIRPPVTPQLELQLEHAPFGEAVDVALGPSASEPPQGGKEQDVPAEERESDPELRVAVLPASPLSHQTAIDPIGGQCVAGLHHHCSRVRLRKIAEGPGAVTLLRDRKRSESRGCGRLTGPAGSVRPLSSARALSRCIPELRRGARVRPRRDDVRSARRCARGCACQRVSAAC